MSEIDKLKEELKELENIEECDEQIVIGSKNKRGYDNVNFKKNQVEEEQVE